ncbi:MAG: hypothetical protein WA864_27830 [Acetobacteraceae bacterium]|jgi:hypothetical protein
MPACECLPKCIFFHDWMPNKPASAELLKKRFCLGDNKMCARYQVRAALGPDGVPADLFPNQAEKVSALLTH